jgi:outer membrane protein assembly factor BamE (lipoprotein component of BamABCDE complex)
MERIITLPSIRPFAAGLILAVFVAAAGCTPQVTTHGTPMTRMEMADLTPGVDTRGSVRRQLGQPITTSVLEGETWFYVSTIMEQVAYRAPTLVDRKVIAISFDESGLVTEVNRYGTEDGVVVALRTETTPTFGRELTVAQQLFGNIGRISGDQLTGGR